MENEFEKKTLNSPGQEATEAVRTHMGGFSETPELLLETFLGTEQTG